jgi:hypothetical protein
MNKRFKFAHKTGKVFKDKRGYLLKWASDLVAEHPVCSPDDGRPQSRDGAGVGDVLEAAHVPRVVGVPEGHRTVARHEA